MQQLRQKNSKDKGSTMSRDKHTNSGCKLVRCRWKKCAYPTVLKAGRQGVGFRTAVPKYENIFVQRNHTVQSLGKKEGIATRWLTDRIKCFPYNTTSATWTHTIKTRRDLSDGESWGSITMTTAAGKTEETFCSPLLTALETRKIILNKIRTVSVTVSPLPWITVHNLRKRCVSLDHQKDICRYCIGIWDVGWHVAKQFRVQHFLNFNKHCLQYFHCDHLVLE